MDIDELETRPAAATIYQTLEDKGKFAGRTNILFSMVMIGKISPHITSVQAVASHFESLILQFKPPDQITGLMLIYPNHVVNILETSFRTIMSILRSLNKSEKLIECYVEYYTELLNKDRSESEDPVPFAGFDQATLHEIGLHSNLAPLTHNRIMMIKDNLVHRVYRTYEVLVLDMEPIELARYDKPEDTDERLFLDMLNQLHQLSLFLADEPMKGQEDYVPEIFKMKLKELLRNLRETNPELIPQQVIVGYFAELSTFPGIIPVQEYLNFYDIPYETSLQSETTWPLAKKSFLYV